MKGQPILRTALGSAVLFLLPLLQAVGLPNLTPYQPSSWSDKIVVSRATGTRTNSTGLTTADTLYVSWAVINNGISSTASRFYIALYVDGLSRKSWYADPPLATNRYVWVGEYSIDSLSAGIHTIKITADSTGTIVESNEGDNDYTRTFTVSSPNSPNLTPYQPSGWSDKIVVSRATGTTTDSTGLKSSDSLYVDWTVINNGPGPATNRFYTALYVDEVFQESWYTDPPMAVDWTASVEDHPIGSLSPGTHTIRITADSTGTLGEGDEGDNDYTKTLNVGLGNGMVLIPAGSFTMGNCMDPSDVESSDDPIRELPLHSVYVSAFYMDQYLVTKALWDQVYQWAIDHGYSFESTGSGKAANHPVQTVHWFDAVKWCNARSEKEGRIPAYYTDATLTAVYRTGEIHLRNDWVKWDVGYRLPTEAEWQKAARGGASGHRFPWADADTITHSRANYFSSIDSRWTYDISPTRGYHPTFSSGGEPYTSPVGYFAPNGYGLYDMAGNVWGWCWDWHSSDYYGTSPTTDPRGPASGSVRIECGGAWGAYAYRSRTACRTGCDSLLYGDWYIGFRTVLSATGTAPAVTWPSPTHITYGAPLSGSQLNATASVPGNFVYTPPIGTVLKSGQGQVLSVTFTPTDALDYTTTTLTARLNVLKALLTVKANDASRAYGSGNPSFSATITGFVNGDTAAAVSGAPGLSTTATAASPVGTYDITPTLGTLSAADYRFGSFVKGKLTVVAVNQAPSFVKGPDITIDENAGPRSFAGWATKISAGPTNESVQKVTFVVVANDSPGLFVAGPAVSADGTLTFTAAGDSNGVANVTIVLKDDGGTANGGQDTSAVQSFTLTVRPTPKVGSLQVTLGPAAAVTAGAQWRRVGTTVWFNSAAIESGVPVGTNHVEFKAVSGWQTPPVQTVRVAKDQTTTATGTYGWIVGTLVVTLKPSEAVTAGARWQFQGMGVWRESGVAVSGVPTNRYTIEFKTVAGWTTPAAQTVTVLQNQTATLEADYLQPPTITAGPQSQAALVGADVTFNVVAAGTAPLSYQWRFNGSPIAGATSMTLRLNPVQISQAGYYSVVVTNLAGSATSPSALLTLPQAILTGTVTDALNGQLVAGVSVVAGGRSALTDAQGRYVLANLTEGVLKADFDADVTSGNAPLTVHFVNLSTTTALTLTGEKASYATYRNRQVRVVAAATNVLNFSISPVLTQGTRMVLNWGPVPKDLDLHLQIEGTSHHVSFNDRNTPYGRLDHDETGGWGPETLTVDQFYPGSYHYYVEHYDVYMPGSRLTNSMAQVHIYRGADELKVVSVPTTGSGAFWHVCTVDGETGAIRLINQITDTAALPAGGVADPGGSAGSEGLAGVRFLWDFGDGTASTNESPVKAYGQAGSYAVSLRVDGEKGQSDLKVKPEFVVVGGGSAPRLGVRWLGGGAVLSVSGVVGKTYRIEGAPTVGAGSAWLTLATITLSQPVQNWTDEQSGATLTRYYRAVLVP